PPGTRLLADEVATLSAVFSHVGVIAEPAHLTGKRRGNCVLLASQRPLPDGIDRALRSDAVSVRLARQDRGLALARAGTVLGGDGPVGAGPGARPHREGCTPRGPARRCAVDRAVGRADHPPTTTDRAGARCSCPVRGFTGVPWSERADLLGLRALVPLADLE